MDRSLITMPPLQVLHFYMQDVNACINLQYIERVLPIVALEFIPGSPPYLIGLMNFAGNSIPVIDLAWRLQLNCYQSYTVDTPILLCSDGHRRVGFLVDKVIGIVDVEKNCIQEAIKDSNVFFLAAIMLNSKLSLLINMENILDINYSLS